VAKDLVTQLDIRAARQTLIKALRGKPDVEECARLIEEYFDKLLAWNQQTGWEKIIDTGIWTQPIYERDNILLKPYPLKEILGKGAPYTSYANEWLLRWNCKGPAPKVRTELLMMDASSR